MPGQDGFSYDPDVLRAIPKGMWSASDRIDEAIDKGFTHPDAGESSAQLGAAVNAVLEAAANCATGIDMTAAKVDEASGSYDETENNAAGAIERKGQEGWGAKNMPLN